MRFTVNLTLGHNEVADREKSVAHAALDAVAVKYGVIEATPLGLVNVRTTNDALIALEAPKRGVLAWAPVSRDLRLVFAV